MTGKARRPRRSTASSSFVAAAPSKPARDVLVLGRHLVVELQLEKSVDTLGRWLAHHVAELIARAETAEEDAKRTIALAEAVDTILRIWQHRGAIENRLNPLADLRPAIEVLRKLGRETPPWSHIPSQKRNDASWHAYRALRSLTICLALLELEDREVARRTADRTQGIADYLSNDEKEIIAGIELWAAVAHLDSEPARKPARRHASKLKQQESSIDLLETTRTMIKNVRAALDRIEEQL